MGGLRRGEEWRGVEGGQSSLTGLIHPREKRECPECWIIHMPGVPQNRTELVMSGRVQSSWGAGRLGQRLGQGPGRRLGQGLGQGKGLWLDSPEEGNRTESGD